MKYLIPVLLLLSACATVPRTPVEIAESGIEWCIKARPSAHFHFRYTCSEPRAKYCSAIGKPAGCREAREYEFAASTWVHPLH